ncbi:MAG TPA: hypothetical protein VFA04_27750 [Bryobacteraceae bacterium]|nr:hypothetical protein [Bryobacteraceae bacterium]
MLRASAAGLGALALAADKPRFNVNDYHVHLDQKFTLNDAAALAKQLGVKFGIAEHAGSREYPYPNLIDTDDKLNAWIDFLENRPVWKGVQAEGIDWWRQFSKELIIRLDYCLGDAMTFIEKDGRQVRLWVPEQVKISSPQDFMDRYTAFNVEVLNKSPLDIFAHPTYLPEVLQKDFDALWTRERMAKVVDAAKRNGVAIEIDAEFQLPRAPFLEMARKAGLKFSFGANIRPGTASRLDWCIATAERYGLGNQDLFVPAAQEQKPLLRRGFAHP